MNLLNKIKENASKDAKNNKDENFNENSHNNILLKTILNKKLNKNKNINSFPLIKTMRKKESNSAINIKSLNENKKEKNNHLILSHGNINNLTKSKSQIKLKICDTINTKIKNLKYNNKTKTENNYLNLKNNKNNFSS